MVDFIFELLFEIIFEGALEVSSHKKVPMPLRVLALFVFLLIYGFILVWMFLLGYEAAKSGSTGAAVMMYIVDALLLVAVIHMIRKQFKKHRE